jgi:hypothetical protein
LAEMPRPDQTFVLVTTGRAEASELAFYLPTQPRVYLWNGTGAVVSQYDLWGGPQDRQGWDALLVTPSGARPPEPVAAAFEKVESVGEITVPIGHGRARQVQLWRGAGFREWPRPARPT